MKKISFLLFLASALFFVACKKEQPIEPSEVERMTDLRVPSGFLFNTADEILFVISVSDDRFGAMAHRITFYDGNPLEGGLVIAVGAGTVNKPFIGKLDLATITKEIYVSKKDPNGDLTIRKGSISGNRLEMDFAYLKDNTSSRAVSPDCVSGCNRTATGTNQNVAVTNGTTCITGNFSGNLTINGNATARICGTATIQNLNMNGSTAVLIITNTATVTFSNNFNFQGLIRNFGSMNANNGMTSQSGGFFENEGNMTVGNTLTVGGSGISVNNDKLTVNGRLQINSDGSLVNNCRIDISQDSNIDGAVDNYGSMIYQRSLTIQSTTTRHLTLHNAAMVSAQNLMLNKTIRGVGSKSLVKITGTTTINSSGALRGNLQFCDTNGIETNNGSVDNTVDFNCNLYIPTNYCNPSGNGTPPNTDSDGDNVPDPNDDFPDDPNSAFGVFYPSNGGYHTLLFEDLWPGLGDYDMNDVVIDFQYNLILDASNNITKIRAKYILRASGGASPAGFGVELPILRSNVASVTGAELEVGHSNAVIAVIQNTKDHLRSFNTMPGSNMDEPVTFNVEINLSSPVSLSVLGLGVYNPFIWMVNSPSGRGHEIHLPGKRPTALADYSLFGTKNDASNPSAGKFYQSINNLPWAIHVPQIFAYPIEKADICITYINFPNWAQTAGQQNQDWYKLVPENVNIGNVFQ
jgi:LruC domain-containing protein